MGAMAMAKTELCSDDTRFETEESRYNWTYSDVSREGSIRGRRDTGELDEGQRDSFVPDPKFQRSKDFRSAHWHRGDRPFKSTGLFTNLAKPSNKHT